MPLTTAVIDWAGSRGIGRSTLERVRAAGDTEGKTVGFPYFAGGKLANVKYRALGEKKFWMRDGGDLVFWNLDAVLSGPMSRVFVCEGEMDGCALIEAGVPVDQVLSVPNGAPREASDDPTNTDRYRFVDTGLEAGLSAVKEFVLLTDSDQPGKALRKDLARLLGAGRCAFADWPDGIKDANEMLLKDGPEALRELVEKGAQVWPVEGLYRLSELPEPPDFELWQPGYPEWESKLRFAPTTVSVLTGHPGHGKSLMAMQLWFNVCRDYRLRAAVASFETRPKPFQRRNLRQFYVGKPQKLMTDAECRRADAWIEDHMLWLFHEGRNSRIRPTLDWILETAEVAVVRHRARVLVIDPWNKLESTRPHGMNETDYIGQSLDACIDFARDMDCHVQIVAHPAKVLGKSAKEPPGLEDIAGSKNWHNRVDQGITIHRPTMFRDGERQTGCDLMVLKSRYEELGYPCMLQMEYNLQTCRYRSTDYDSRI